MNLLQQTLLDLWLGDRDDLCVVGDDYQSIYAFTGAGPEHLLGVPTRFPHAHGRPARGELPLDAAGARAREPARAEARRRREDAARACSPTGRSRSCARSRSPRGRGRRDRRARSARSTCPLEDVAILARTNARLTDFEELLHDARHPVPGRVAARARRGAPARAAGSSARARDAAEAVRAAALDAGWLEQLPDKLGERELVRQTDLAPARRARVGVRRRRGRVRRRPAPAVRLRAATARAACTC